MTNRESQDRVQQLVDLVGPTLTAMASGTRKREHVTDWLNGTTEPTGDNLERIKVAIEVLEQVGEAQGCEIARAWFIGESCCVNNALVSPASAIRQGAYKTACSSAALFIEDGWL